MTRKIILCVLGLLLLGMLYVPVAAEPEEPGNWSFYIVNTMEASPGVIIDDGITGFDKFGKVDISNSQDQVAVLFVGYTGVETTLTFTKDTIKKFREEHPGQEPALHAWGSPGFYDVDAVGLSPDYSTFTIYDHLKKRGLVHHDIGETVKNMWSDLTPSVSYVWDEKMEDDYWSFYIVNNRGVVILNDGETIFGSYGKAYISNTQDQVKVQFDGCVAYEATLLITKDYIDKIRTAYPGQKPVLYSWGGPDTYDVDAGVLAPDYSTITTYEHLRKRGLVHHDIGKQFHIYRPFFLNPRPHSRSNASV